MMNDEIIKDYLQKNPIMPIKDICIKHKRSAQAIYNLLKKHNIPRNRPTGIKKKEKIDLAIKEYLNCQKKIITQEEVCKKYNISTITFRKYLQKLEDNMLNRR